MTRSLEFNGFAIRITPDELDGGFISECLDIPGCFSQGETFQEAVENLVEAIVAIIEVKGREDAERLAGQYAKSGDGTDNQYRLIAAG